MKKRVIFLLIFLLFVFTVPVYADGISIVSDNGDNVSIMGDVTVDRKTDGNIIVVFGNVDIEDEVNGNVVSVIGNVKVNAKVGGQIVAALGNVELTDRAEVGGNIVAVGTISEKAGAKVFGQEVEIFGQKMGVDLNVVILVRAILSIVFALFALLFGLLLLLISNKKFKEISASIENGTGRKIVLGLLGFLGATIISIVLIFTFVVPLLYLVLLLVGTVFASMYFGKMLIRAFSSKSNVFVEFITGLTTITLIKIVLIFLIPQSEFIINAVIYVIFALFINSLGVGILLDLKYGRKNREINTAEK